MVEVHGLLALRIANSCEALAVQGVWRLSQKAMGNDLVALGVGRAALLYFLYSLFVGSCRKAPRY